MISSFLAWRHSSWNLLASLVLVLRPGGLSLVFQEPLVALICLQPVEVLYENMLVLEHIPFHLQVQGMIHVVVNLLRFMASSEQMVQNPHCPHSGHILWHFGICCTLSLTMPIFLSFQQAKVFFWH